MNGLRARVRRNRLHAIGYVLLHVVFAAVLGLAVVFACAMITGCAEVARDTYEYDLRKCATDTPIGDDRAYDACKAEKKAKWHVDGGPSDGNAK